MIAGNIGENFIGEAKPDNFDDTWCGWLLLVTLVGFIEYKLFENKEDKN